MTFGTLKIVQAGDPVLRQRARLVTPEEIRSREMQQLIEWMRETMRDAPGVGLAAPQVGIERRIFVYDIGEGPQTVINPVTTAPFSARH